MKLNNLKYDETQNSNGDKTKKNQMVTRLNLKLWQNKKKLKL